MHRPTTVLEQWLGWDQHQNLHPDERFLTLVASAIDLPSTVSEYLNTETSPANPHNVGHAFFPYGTWPPLATRALGHWIDRTDFDGLTAVGRAVSAVADLLTLVLLYFIGRRITDDTTAIVAVGLAACCVLSIQHARFWTVESVGTLLVTLTVLWCVVIARKPCWWAWLLAGVGIGAATATKISLWSVAGLVPLAAAMRILMKARADTTARGRARQIAGLLAGCAAAAAVALVTFRLLMPYSFAGPHVLDLRPNPKWLENLREVSRLMNGAANFPPALQWTDRTPYVHPLGNLFFWGLGPALAMTGFVGWVASLARLLGSRGRTLASGLSYLLILATAGWFGLLGGASVTFAALIGSWVWVAGLTIQSRRDRLLLALPVAWVSTFLAYQGVQFVKPMRYLLPICPFICLLAAVALVQCVRSAWQHSDGRTGALAGIRRLSAVGLAAAVVLTSAAWAWGFSAIYRRPNPRVEASRWIFSQLPAAVTSVLSDNGDQWQVPVEIAAPFQLSEHGPTREGGLRSPRTGWLRSLQLRLEQPPSGATIEATVTANDGTLTRGHAELPSSGGDGINLDLVTIPLAPFRIDSGHSYRVGVTLTRGSAVQFNTGVVAVEEWDDALPLPLDERASFQIYQSLTLPTYAVDGSDKLDTIVEILTRSDLLVLSSHRGVASVRRIPRRYPLQIRFFEILESGELGYELVNHWTSWPRLLHWWLPDQEIVGRWPPTVPNSIHLVPAEEPFSVYDHPRVFVFRRGPRFDPEDARAALRRNLRPSRGISPRQATAAAWEQRLRPVPVVGPWLARRVQDRSRRIEGAR
jgi:hypothetical protein